MGPEDTAPSNVETAGISSFVLLIPQASTLEAEFHGKKTYCKEQIFQTRGLPCKYPELIFSFSSS